jgi:hypothetical protein
VQNTKRLWRFEQALKRLRLWTRKWAERPLPIRFFLTVWNWFPRSIILKWTQWSNPPHLLARLRRLSSPWQRRKHYTIEDVGD